MRTYIVVTVTLGLLATTSFGEETFHLKKEKTGTTPSVRVTSEQNDTAELRAAFAEDHKKAIAWFDAQGFPRPMRGEPKEANWFWDMSSMAFDRQLWKEAWAGFHYTYELFAKQRAKSETVRCLRKLEIVYKRMGKHELARSCVAQSQVNFRGREADKAVVEAPSVAGETTQEERLDASAVELVEYSNDQERFSISYPKGWHKEFQGGGLIIHPTNARRVVDGHLLMFSPSITILVGEGQSTTDPVRTSRQIVDGMRNNFADYKPLWNRKTSIASGEVGIMYCFRFTKSGKAFRAVGLVVSKGRRVFWCDISALDSHFQDYESLASRILLSLQIK